MSALAVEQPDLWGDTDTLTSSYEAGVGRILSTPGGGWRARWTGTRYGWMIDRRITWTEPHRYWTGAFTVEVRWEERSDWEGWEVELPFGVEHIHGREDAAGHLCALMADYGDDPRWLQAVDRRLRAALATVPA